MAKAQLNQTLLAKMAEKTDKEAQYVRERISRKASKWGVPSEVAQVLWSMELGIGTASALRSLPPHMQEQVQSGLPTLLPQPQASGDKKGQRRTRPTRQRDPIRLLIQILLSDEELKERCEDLLRARGNFDRAFREATTVLEDRIRRLSGVRGLNPEQLVGRVLNVNNPILVVSDDAGEREGFFSVCKGLVLAFRNPHHHQLSDKLTREDALRFCGFVDSLLTVLASSRKV